MALIFPTVVITLLFLMLFSGCGNGVETSTANPPQSVAPPAQTAVAAPESSQPPPEQTTPYGRGSKYAQSVGTLVDGLQLKEIRWADHGSYFRIVFEMATLDGKPVLQVPHAETSLTNYDKQLRVVLGGIRSLGDAANVQASELTVGDSMVTDIKRLPERDDQALVYIVNLSRPTTYSLAGLGSPGRIVIDIMK